MYPTGRRHTQVTILPYVMQTPDIVCEVAGPCEERRHSRHNRSAKHCRYNQQEAPSTVWSRCETGCHHTCTPSIMSGHCNKRRSESGDKLAKTWASSKDLDTTDRQQNTGQLETDVTKCGQTWTSWGVVATDLSGLRVMMMMIYCG